jgi:hypothetical protein
MRSRRHAGQRNQSVRAVADHLIITDGGTVVPITPDPLKGVSTKDMANMLVVIMNRLEGREDLVFEGPCDCDEEECDRPEGCLTGETFAIRWDEANCQWEVVDL